MDFTHQFKYCTISQAKKNFVLKKFILPIAITIMNQMYIILFCSQFFHIPIKSLDKSEMHDVHYLNVYNINI
jgi:hypothetical protein